MTIAQVAPLFESGPPPGYGGTERGVSSLTEALVRQGHQVTLFASGDAVTQARLVAAFARALRLDQACRDQLAQPLVQLEQVLRQASAKDAFLGQAQALLCPIDWPEPLGLVMSEALACGTPVVAYRRGSVPDVLEVGVTGGMVEGLEEAVQAGERVPLRSRPRCRQGFEERFSPSRMPRDDPWLHRRLLRAGKGRSAA